jgi:hypothetical protein
MEFIAERHKGPWEGAPLASFFAKIEEPWFHHFHALPRLILEILRDFLFTGHVG